MDGRMETTTVADMLQDRKKKMKMANSLKGQRPTPAMHRSRAQLAEDLLNMGLKAHEQRSNQMYESGHVRVVFIGEAYAPTVEPLNSLNPIVLSDLRLETHHRGRVLIVKTFCEPVRSMSIQNAVEDVQGNVNRLSIYNLPSSASPNEVLPKNAIVAIKEPYLTATAEEGLTVRVDHPSDFILLDSHDTLVPRAWRSDIDTEKTASQLEQEANGALQQGGWQKAVELYSKALAKTDKDTDLETSLRRNRAQAYLHLRKYELASKDALAAVISGDKISDEDKLLNVISYFRAGKAQYQLGDFDEAGELFKKSMNFDCTKETAIFELDRTIDRVMEQINGIFNFDAMAQSAASGHHRLDHANFTRLTMIGDAGKRGRGLFATQDIKRGNLVMAEKAFSAVFEDEVGKGCSFVVNVNSDRAEIGTHAERLCVTIDEIRRNPIRGSKLLELTDGGKSGGKKIALVDGAAVVNAFQVQSIAELNGFGCPESHFRLDDAQAGRASFSTGIWLRASYMNHACLPNTAQSFIGDMMIIRATCDIKMGEEIFTSYPPPSSEFPRRTEELTRWGIQCDCRLCQAEKKVALSTFTTRNEIWKEGEAFISANLVDRSDPSATVDSAKLAEAKDILRRLEATYDQSIYGTLPRLGCVAIDMWLVTAESTKVDAGSPAQVSVAGWVRLLQHLGYKVNAKGSEASIDTTNGFPCQQAVYAARYSHVTWLRLGKPELAKAFGELAREVYLAITGAMVGFDERFGQLQMPGVRISEPE